MSYKKGTGQVRFKDIKGQKFGRLMAVEFAGHNKQNIAMWKCLCDCGNTRIVTRKSLRSGDCQSCGCLHKEVVSDMLRKKKGVASANALFYSYKHGAELRGLVFNLSQDEFLKLTKRNCFYCGQKPSQIYGQSKSNGYYIYNGVDRLDPARGYTIDNCVASCGTCNLAKQGLTAKQFLELVTKIFNLKKEAK